MNGGAIIPLIAVDPCAIKTYHEAFPLGRHGVRLELVVNPIQRGQSVYLRQASVQGV
jgi:hypothetical protein